MDFEKQIKEQRERIESLEALVKTQVEMIEKLRAQLNARNSSTSHSPPSQDSPKQPNNTAERALRHPVIAKKLSFGSQSERGLRFIERMISVRATLHQQGRSLLDFLVARLSGHHVDLLPA